MILGKLSGNLTWQVTTSSMRSSGMERCTTSGPSTAVPLRLRLTPTGKLSAIGGITAVVKVHSCGRTGALWLTLARSCPPKPTSLHLGLIITTIAERLPDTDKHL